MVRAVDKADAMLTLSSFQRSIISEAIYHFLCIFSIFACILLLIQCIHRPWAAAPAGAASKNIAAGSGVSVETTAQHRQCSSICLSAAVPTDAALSL